MASNNGFALLIGVDDYSTYGAGASLKGSREDVLKLYWLCRKLLNLAPENIRVLTSPPLSAGEFHATDAPPPETLGPATREAIQAGVQWLADRMAQDGAAPGLLTFSGHGWYSKETGPLLCPTDIGRDPGKGIAVRDLSKMDALQKVRDRLTVVLDCCHASPTAPATDLRSHTGLPHDATPEEVAADHADFDISERVLLAARPGQSAHQALLGKVFHGALTFALVTVAEQWKASQDPGGSGMHVSYKQLLKRVRKLLWSLRMKQSVRLRVPEEKRKAIRELPFFGMHAALTARRPDAERDKVQLDPNFYYTIYNGTNVVAQVVVLPGTSTSSTVYVQLSGAASNTSLTTQTTPQEYWYWDTTQVSNLTSSSSLSFTYTSMPSTTSTSPLKLLVPNATCGTQSCSATPTWQSSLTTPPGTNVIVAGPACFVPNTGSTSTVRIALLLNTTSTGSITHAYWYVVGLPTTPTPAGYIQPGNSAISLPPSYWGAISF